MKIISGQKLKSGLTALAVGIVLIAALDWTAAAATGRATILGRWNQADHTTTIKNTATGPALALRARKGPALKVNNSKRIQKLNADKLDGLSSSDYKTNRNTIYQWTVAAHTGAFTQAVPTQQPGSYLITFNVQMNGAAGDPGNPNVINCRIVQSGLSGTVAFQKAILADTQVTSVGTPPALNGTSPLIVSEGDSLALDCTMTRNAQQWSTTQYQPVTVNLLRTDGSFVYVAPLGKAAVLKKTAH
jgi:hypothetical protein